MISQEITSIQKSLQSYSTGINNKEITEYLSGISFNLESIAERATVLEEHLLVDRKEEAI